MSPSTPPTVVGVIGGSQQGKTTLALALLRRLAGRDRAEIRPPLTDFLARLERGWGLWSPLWFRARAADSTLILVDCPSPSPLLYETLPALDGAIFVHRAGHPIMPETRQALLLARQAGVRSLVGFLTRGDRVLEHHADGRELELRQLLHEYELPGDDIAVFRGDAAAALQGEESALRPVDDLLAAIRQAVRPRCRDANAPFLFCGTTGSSLRSQWDPATSSWEALGVGNQRCRVRGRIAQGRVGVGERVEVLFGEHAAVPAWVLGLTSFDESVLGASVGDCVTVELRNEVGSADMPDFKPGGVVAAPGAFRLHKKFRTHFTVGTAEEGGKRALRAGSKPVFWIGTAKVKGTIELAVWRALPVGQRCEGWVTLDRPCLLIEGWSFSCRHHSGATAYGDIEEVIE